MDIEHKYIDLASFKMNEDGPGELTGYASEFGILDYGGDIALPGAFTATREKFLKAGFTAHSHDWNVATGVIGYPVEANEDQNGFSIKTRFHSTPDAQLIRTKAKERMEAGKDVKLSIGYKATEVAYINQADYKSELPKYVRPDTLADALKNAYTFSRVRLLKAVELFEHSIVTVPMLESAQATSVKSMPEDVKENPMTFEALQLSIQSLNPEERKAAMVDWATGAEIKGAFNDALAERNENPWSYWDVCCCLIYQLLWFAEMNEDVGASVDLPAKFDEILSEFTARYRAWFVAEIADEAAEGVGAEEVIYAGLLSLGEKKSRFGDFSDQMLAALDVYVKRAQDITAWKASKKEGRMISGANVERMKTAMAKIKTAMDHMQTVHDDMDALVTAAEPKEEPKGVSAEDANRLLAGILKQRFDVTQDLRIARSEV